MPDPRDPHEYDGKMRRVGTPGIFHRPGDSFYTHTFCGLDGHGCRATDHELRDEQPCVVCFAPPRWAAAAPPPQDAQ